jgi:hypothetical protein
MKPTNNTSESTEAFTTWFRVLITRTWREKYSEAFPEDVTWPTDLQPWTAPPDSKLYNLNPLTCTADDIRAAYRENPRELSAASETDRFGVCPECGKNDGFLNIGRNHGSCATQNKVVSVAIYSAVVE